MSQPTKQPANY